MSTTSISSTTQTDPTSSSLTSATATGSDALGQTQFLQLLTAQLQNQDPTSPMDDSNFASELAQFSSLSQLTSVNTNLQQLLVGQASSNQTADAALVGKTVLYDTNTVSLTAGQPATIDANLSGPAANVTAVITNSAGQVVRTIQYGNEPAGQVSLAWNGEGNDGNALPAGTYTVQLTATDTSGNPVTLTQEASSLVTGISFANSYPQLVVSSGDIDLSSVNEIELGSS